MPKTNPAVDAYIAKAAPFAQPILRHVRGLVHEAVPEIEEEIKWSMPFFMYRGIALGNIAGFKQHCAVGLWGKEANETMRADGVASKDGMGSLGRITSLDDLPTDKQMLAYLKLGALAISEGRRTTNYTRPPRVAKPEPAVPAELAAVLKKNKAAQKVFDGFTPGCRREYVEWVAEAKREETRVRRAEQAAAWIAEGKKRNWKYENC